MRDPEVTEVTVRMVSPVPPSPGPRVLEMVVPCLSLQALLSPLGTVMNTAPSCPHWVSCGTISPCQSSRGTVWWDSGSEAGKDLYQSHRIWSLLFLLHWRAILKLRSVGKKGSAAMISGLAVVLPPARALQGAPSRSPYGVLVFHFHSLTYSSFPYLNFWSS